MPTGASTNPLKVAKKKKEKKQEGVKQTFVLMSFVLPVS